MGVKESNVIIVLSSREDLWIYDHPGCPTTLHFYTGGQLTTWWKSVCK